jgi:hypothetical protein
LDSPRLGGHRRARQLRRHLTLRHGSTADHRRCGQQWCIHHQHPHLHHQQRYVQRRPGDDRQPRRARAGHPARWPSAGRRRFQHREHHGEYGRTAHHRLPDCYADSYANCYGNGYAYADSYANCDGNGYAYTDSYANCDSNSYAYADSYANCDSNGYAYADSDANCDGNGYAYADSYANCDSNRHAYPDSYANCDGNSYAYADSYANRDGNSYAHTNTYAYVDAYGPAETKPDTEAISDAAASPVGAIRKRLCGNSRENLASSQAKAD